MAEPLGPPACRPAWRRTRVPGRGLRGPCGSRAGSGAAAGAGRRCSAATVSRDPCRRAPALSGVGGGWPRLSLPGPGGSMSPRSSAPVGVGNGSSGEAWKPRNLCLGRRQGAVLAGIAKWRRCGSCWALSISKCFPWGHLQLSACHYTMEMLCLL